MRNTTITIEESILEEARKYVENFGLSFNAWVNKLIKDALRKSPEISMKDLLALADKIAGNSGGTTWTKDEIYER